MRKVFQLFLEARRSAAAIAPGRADRVLSKQAVLILRESSQRHEQDPFLGPAGLGGDGEYLGG